MGTCYDNAVVEHFFGSLKHDWVFKIAQPTREHMKKAVAADMKYYNLERLHTTNGDQPPTTGLTADESQLQLKNHYIRGYEAKRKKCNIALNFFEMES